MTKRTEPMNTTGDELLPDLVVQVVGTNEQVAEWVSEAEIHQSFDLGSCTLHFGIADGQHIVAIDNAAGPSFYGMQLRIQADDSPELDEEAAEAA